MLDINVALRVILNKYLFRRICCHATQTMDNLGNTSTPASNSTSSSILSTSLTNLTPGHLNNDLNAEVVPEEIELGDWVRITSSVLVTIYIIVGTPSNLLICWAVYKTKSLRTGMNMLVVNLMIADLFCCCICAPVILVLCSTISHAVLLCRLLDFCHVASGSVILLTMTYLSFERYQAIDKPYNVRERLARIKIAVCAIWFGGFACGAASQRMARNPLLYICEDYMPDNDRKYEFGLFIFMPLSCICITLIILFYLGIFLQIRNHEEKRQNNSIVAQKVKKIHPAVVSVALSAKHGDDRNSHFSKLEIAKSEPGKRNITSFTSFPEVRDPSLVDRKTRRTKSETDAPQKCKKPAKIEPKYSQDSKNLVSVQMAMQNFLVPPRNRSRAGSNESLYDDANEETSSKRNEKGRTKHKKLYAGRRFYELDLLKLGCKSSDDNFYSASSAMVENGGKNPQPAPSTDIEERFNERRNSYKADLNTDAHDEDDNEFTDACDTHTNTDTHNTGAKDISVFIHKTNSLAPKQRNNIKTIPTEDAAHNKAEEGCSIKKGMLEKSVFKESDKLSDNNTGEDGTEVSDKNRKGTLKRKTAIFDIIKIHDFNGNVTRQQVRANAIAGDICVMNKENREHGKRKLEQRTAKRAALIVGAFLCCWTPLLLTIVTSLLLTSSSVYVVRIWTEAYLFTLTLALMVGLLNPVVYGVVNNQFRTALLRIVKKLWCFAQAKSKVNPIAVGDDKRY